MPVSSASRNVLCNAVMSGRSVLQSPPGDDTGTPSIDLNADLGEGESADSVLLGIVSSCSVACGGHTGDADSMAATVRLALANGVAIGAHPSYPDREGFGRRQRFAAGAALYDALAAQTEALEAIAADLGARLVHLKPHGALYNDAAADPELAGIVARVTAEAHGRLRLYGPPSSALEFAAADFELGFVREGFADRAYTQDGSLVPRTQPDAVHADLEVIASQAVSLAADSRVLARDGTRIELSVDTLCLHGDTPGAASAAVAVRDALIGHGIAIRPPGDGVSR
jgi:UPF0271 protein